MNKILIRAAAVLVVSFGAMPAFADSEASPPQQVQPAAAQPSPGYVYNGTGAPVQVYNTQQNRGTWLFPPSMTAK